MDVTNVLKELNNVEKKTKKTRKTLIKNLCKRSIETLPKFAVNSNCYLCTLSHVACQIVTRIFSLRSRILYSMGYATSRSSIEFIADA